MLQCVAVCCRVLQCVEVSLGVLQCITQDFLVLCVSFGQSVRIVVRRASVVVAVCCSVLQCDAVCVAVCCSVLQCVTSGVVQNVLVVVTVYVT